MSFAGMDLGQQVAVATSHLSSQHRHLVAQHDDLDRRLAAFSAQAPEYLDHAPERQVEELQGHAGIFAAVTMTRNVLIQGWTDFSAPTRSA
ncbi:MAG: hypothetical protein ACYCS7_03015 [Acidimicrobiales bacterium]